MCLRLHTRRTEGHVPCHEGLALEDLGALVLCDQVSEALASGRAGASEDTLGLRCGLRLRECRLNGLGLRCRATRTRAESLPSEGARVVDGLRDVK